MKDYKDRGMIKWQGMMLTDHVKKIKEWDAEDKYIPRPRLEEFELNSIAEEIERAYKGKSTIKLTYWRDGELSDDYGIPIEINTSNKTILIDDPFSTARYSFNDIVAASLIFE